MPVITMLLMGVLAALIYWIVLWALTVRDDPTFWPDEDEGMMVLEPPYDWADGE